MKYYFNIKFPFDRSTEFVEYAIGVPGELVTEMLQEAEFEAEAKRRSASDNFECDAAAVLAERLCRADCSTQAKHWIPILPAKFFIYSSKPEDLGQPSAGHIPFENPRVELWRIKALPTQSLSFASNVATSGRWSEPSPQFGIVGM